MQVTFYREETNDTVTHGFEFTTTGRGGCAIRVQANAADATDAEWDAFLQGFTQPDAPGLVLDSVWFSWSDAGTLEIGTGVITIKTDITGAEAAVVFRHFREEARS